jgi:hypothetical protein
MKRAMLSRLKAKLTAMNMLSSNLQLDDESTLETNRDYALTCGDFSPFMTSGPVHDGG